MVRVIRCHRWILSTIRRYSNGLAIEALEDKGAGKSTYDCPVISHRDINSIASHAVLEGQHLRMFTSPSLN